MTKRQKNIRRLRNLKKRKRKFIQLEKRVKEYYVKNELKIKMINFLMNPVHFLKKLKDNDL